MRNLRRNKGGKRLKLKSKVTCKTTFKKNSEFRAVNKVENFNKYELQERYKCLNLSYKDYIICKLGHIKYLKYSRPPQLKCEKRHTQDFPNAVQGALSRALAAGLSPRRGEGLTQLKSPGCP